MYYVVSCVSVFRTIQTKIRILVLEFWHLLRVRIEFHEHFRLFGDSCISVIL